MSRYFSLLFFLPLALPALPLRFELQQGHYVARGIVLTDTGPVFDGNIRMTVAGARWTAPRGKGNVCTPAVAQACIPQFDSVRYPAIRPGIDLVFHGPTLEYDFVLAPHADPRAIRFRFPNTRLALEAGDLLAGPLRHHRPLAWQDTPAGRHYIDAAYRLADHEVTFRLGPYDPALALAIDPVLTYATFAGGSGSETGSAIAADSAGNTYLAGTTTSADFTIVKATPTSGSRGFLAKLDPTGANVLNSIVFAGATMDAIAIDATNNVVVAGSITGAAFPKPTSGAFQQTGATGYAAKFSQDATGFKLVFLATFAATPTALALDPKGAIYLTGTAGLQLPATAGSYSGANGGGTCVNPDTGPGPCPDAFALKLSADGATVVYATYLGGRDDDAGHAIAVNAAGEAYIAGDTASFDYPITPGAFPFKGRIVGDDAVFGDAFLTKLDAGGAHLIFSTFLGGTAADIAWAVALDKDGNAYVAGSTQSANFPVTAGVVQSKYAGGTPLADGADPAGDAFVAKFTASGSPVWATFVGGSGREAAYALALDALGNVYAAGFSESADFPWTANSVRGCRSGGPFVAELDGNGTRLLRTSSVGGMGFDIANALTLDAGGGVYLAGDTASRPFFATGAAAQRAYGGGDSDAFAAKVAWNTDGRVFISCVLNAASFAPGNFAFFPQGTVAPGEVVSLFGVALGPDPAALAQPAPGAPYPTTLGGTQVFFDNIPAPMWYAGSGQINAIVPYGIKPPVTQMTVLRGGVTDGPRILPVAASVPGIFTATGTGTGQAAVFNQDGSYNSVANPAPRGSVITFYAVGAGAMSPAQSDGAVQPGVLPLSVPAGDVKVQIRGADAKVLYAGAAPGYIAGLLQVNVQVPDTIDFGSSVPLNLSIGGQDSQFNVTIAVK